MQAADNHVLYGAINTVPGGWKESWEVGEARYLDDVSGPDQERQCQPDLMHSPSRRGC